MSSAAPPPAPRVEYRPDQAWHYLDDRGDEQGPFGSDQLQEWISKGFLPGHLAMRPADGPPGEYVALSVLCAPGGPFAAPAPRSASPPRRAR